MTTHRAFSAATKEVNRVVNNQTVTATVGKALRETGAALKHASGAEVRARISSKLFGRGFLLCLMAPRDGAFCQHHKDK
jgi:hypothetical protein